MTSEKDFTKGINPLCPNDEAWTTRDEQSSENEVNDFLYALVRLIKPKFVVETGCYLGDGTIKIAKALKENGFGKVMTCDTDPERVAWVAGRIMDKKLQNIAQVVMCTGLELIKDCKGMVDFAFIDSSPKCKERYAEIEALIPMLQPYQMFCLHDTAPQHSGMCEEVKKIKLPSVYFNCPRGLTLFQI